VCTYTSAHADVDRQRIAQNNKNKLRRICGTMFHLRVKVIGRSKGGARSVAGAIAYRVGSRNGAAAMAYRAGEKLRDPRTGKMFDYRKKAAIDANGFGILHAEIMLPANAPDWMADRQQLIDAIEAGEKREDAQLLREVEVSLPRELTFEQQRELVRTFTQEQFVSRGMIADIAIHDERASDGGRNPHAHILLTMRSVSPDGFGPKVRAWNAKQLVQDWRQIWAEMANEALAANGFERRLDWRRHADRGVDLMPDVYVGPSKGRSFDGVLHAARQESRNAAKQANIDLIEADPGRLITAVAREKATFTRADVAFALRRATGLEASDERHGWLLDAALAVSGVETVAQDRRGVARFATRTMIETEVEMARAARSLARRTTFDATIVPPGSLSVEQQIAYLHATQGPDLVAIAGVAGAGKTTTLAAIAGAFGKCGHRVRGAALAGVAARQLRTEAGIPATTLASLLHGWDRKDASGRPAPISLLERGDVLILDEAGMIGSKDMRRVLVEAEKANAKVIIVGDARQLQAIEAGAAFRALVDTHGAANLTDVRRQSDDWQRHASTLLSTHNIPDALALYRRHDRVHGARTTDDAINHLVAEYMADRQTGQSQLVLAHYRADVQTLNERIRSALRGQGLIGDDVRVPIREQVRSETGEVLQRAAYARFAKGDRILFGRNDRTLGVDNGSRGTVLDVTDNGAFAVALADGRRIDFAARDYPDIALGYAMTVHKAQGATFDRTYVLASARMDANLAYVALTRHRTSTRLFYGSDQFGSSTALDRALARSRPKDSTLDYLDAYLARPDRQPRNSDRSGDIAEAIIRRNAALRAQKATRPQQRGRHRGD
jgi:Ti-type conjugative transfer relaxase TraA